MKKQLIVLLIALIGILPTSYAEDKNLLGAEWNFMFNPTKLNPDFTTYDQNTAIIMTKLSYLAYYTKEDVQKAEQAFQSAYPDANVKIDWFDRKGTAGTEYIIFSTKDYLVISFRGTEGKFIDLYTDVKYLAYRNPISKVNQDNSWKGMPSGHAGFRNALKKTMDEGIFQDLTNALTYQNIKKENYPVYTTGHSLGAGLATLFIEPLKYEGYHYSGTYTISAPMSISRLNSAEFAAFESGNGKVIHNIIYYRDLIPRAGVSKGSKLKHVGNNYRICLNKLLVKNEPVAIRFYKLRKLQFVKFHSVANILEILQNPDNSTAYVRARAIHNCICMEDWGQSYSGDLIPKAD